MFIKSFFFLLVAKFAHKVATFMFIALDLSLCIAKCNKVHFVFTCQALSRASTEKGNGLTVGVLTELP